MNQVVAVEEQVRELSANAERIRNDELRVFGAEWMPGDSAAQGDLLLVCIHRLPKSAKPRDRRQLADGDTQGSHHMLEVGECFDADPADVVELIKEATSLVVGGLYLGPVFRGPALLTHPEHGDQQWTSPCVNAVVYQRVWDAERAEARRQKD